MAYLNVLRSREAKQPDELDFSGLANFLNERMTVQPEGLPVQEETGMDRLSSFLQEQKVPTAPTAPQEEGYLPTIGKGISRGILGVLKGGASAFRWLGEAADFEPMARAGADLSADFDKQLTEGILKLDPKVFQGGFWEKPSLKRALEAVAEAVPSLGVSILAGMAGGPAVGAAVFGLITGAPEYEEARRMGLGVGEASFYGGLQVGTSALLELMPMSLFVQGAGKGLLGKAIGKEALEGLTKKLGSTARTEAILGGMSEGLTEGSQQIAQNLIAKYGYDDSREILDGLTESIIGGVGAGTLAGGTMARFRNLQEKYKDTPEFGDDVRIVQDQLEKELGEMGQVVTTKGMRTVPRRETALREPLDYTGGYQRIVEMLRQGGTTIAAKTFGEQYQMAGQDIDRAIIDGLAAREEQRKHPPAAPQAPRPVMAPPAAPPAAAPIPPPEAGRPLIVPPSPIGAKAPLPTTETAGERIAREIPPAKPPEPIEAPKDEWEFTSKKGNRYVKRGADWFDEAGKKITNTFRINAAEKGKTKIEEAAAPPVAPTVTPEVPPEAPRLKLHDRIATPEGPGHYISIVTTIDGQKKAFVRLDTGDRKTFPIEAVTRPTEAKPPEVTPPVVPAAAPTEVPPAPPTAPPAVPPPAPGIPTGAEAAVPTEPTPVVPETTEAETPWQMTPEEVEKAWIDSETTPDMGAWDISAVKNYAPRLRKLAKRFDKGGWQTLDELAPKDRQGRKDPAGIHRQITWLRERGYAQIAWDREGNPYYSKATTEVPPWLTTVDDETVMEKLPPKGEEPVTPTPEAPPVTQGILPGIPTPVVPVPRPGVKEKGPNTFISWIKSKGGLWDESIPEEVSQFGRESRMVGIVNKTTGKAADVLVADAIQDGWLPPDATANDLIEALKSDIAGVKTGKRVLRRGAEAIDQQVAKQMAQEEEATIGAEAATVRQVHTGDLDLKIGDRVLVPTPEGGEEWLDVTDHDTENGVLTLKDGQEIKVSDVFDYIPVVGGEAFGVARKGEALPTEEAPRERTYTADRIKRSLPTTMSEAEKDETARLLATLPDEEVVKLLRGNLEQIRREAELAKTVAARSAATQQELFGGEEAAKGQGDFFAQKPPEEYAVARKPEERRIPPSEAVTPEQIAEFWGKDRTKVHDDGSVSVETQPGNVLHIQWVDQITPDSASLQIGYGKGELAEGEEVRASYKQGTINLVKKADRWDFAHDSIHYLEDLGALSPNDIAVLRGTIKRLVKEGAFETANPKNIGGPEDRATLLADMLTKPPKGILGRIAEKARIWIDKFANFLTGRTTARLITERIRTMDVLKNPPTEAEMSAIHREATAAGPDQTPGEVEYYSRRSLAQYPQVVLDAWKMTEASMAERLKGAWDTHTTDWESKWLDYLIPVKDRFGQQTYQLFTLARGGASEPLSRFFEDGKLVWNGNAISINTKNEGVERWMKSLSGDDALKLPFYVAAKRADKLRTQTYQVRDPQTGMMVTRSKEQWLTPAKTQAIYQWAGANPKTPGQTWDTLAGKLNDYNKSVLDLAEGAGIIDAAKRALWEEYYYLPFRRVLQDPQTNEEIESGPHKSRAVIDAQIRTILGADKQLVDPWKSLVENWAHLISESLRHVAFRNALQASDDMAAKGQPAPLTRVPAKDMLIYRGAKVAKTRTTAAGQTVTKQVPVTFVHRVTGDNLIGMYENGKRVFVRVDDPGLFAAMTNANAKRIDSALMNMFGLAKRVLTKGATITPPFIIANTLRDTLQTALVTKSFVPFWDTYKGFAAIMRKDPIFLRVAAANGLMGSSYVHDGDVDAMGKLLRRVAEREGEGATNSIINTAKKGWELYNKLVRASENAARVGYAIRLAGKNVSHEQMAFESRNILDYSRRGDGATIQALIQMIPFMGARINGLYRMQQAAQENPRAFLAKGGALAALSLLLWTFNKDDEKYKQLEDWDKWSYYHFFMGDNHIRIPKPFETGAIFSSLVETVADTMTDNEDIRHLGNYLLFSTKDNLSLLDIPALLKPVVEQWANKVGYTGRPILTERMKEGLIPALQKEPWTSETLQVVGELIGMSPKRLEHLVRGYTAGFGIGILSASDLMFRNIMRFPEQPPRRMEDYPVIGRFLRETGPPRHTKYEQVFYESMREFDRLAGTLRHYKMTGNLEQAMEFAEDHRAELAYYKLFDKYRARIRIINNELRKVLMSDKISSEEKGERVNRYLQMKNDLFSQADKNYKAAKLREEGA